MFITHYHAVIFDMDGLLIDTEKLAIETFKQSCKAHGLKDFDTIIFKCIGMNAKKTQELLSPHITPHMDYEHFRAHWKREYALAIESGKMKPKPGAQKLLSRLKAHKKPLALATSTASALAKEKLDQVNLLEFFDHIVGGDEITHSKPAPEIYLKAAQLINVHPQNCLALEDSENGVRAAHAAGMTVIQIPDLVEPSADLLTLGHRVMESLTHVLEHHFRQEPELSTAQSP